MIARALRLHETSVQRYISGYLNKGKLMPENGGPTVISVRLSRLKLLNI